MYARVNLEEHKNEISQKIDYAMEVLEDKPLEARKVLEDVLIYIENNL